MTFGLSAAQDVQESERERTRDRLKILTAVGIKRYRLFCDENYIHVQLLSGLERFHSRSCDRGEH